MPDTRPRRVTPEPVAQESNLGDILARAGVVPFNPNVGGADINSVIQGLLTPQPTPQPQAQPLLQQILQNLAGGISVATSRDPGAALGQQLQNQQALRFQREQYAREQSDKMNQIRQQFGLKLLDSQLGEQQDIAKETRLAARSKEERIAREQENVRAANEEFAQKKELANISFENQKKLANIELDFRKNVEANNEVQAKLDRLDKRNQQRVMLELNYTKTLGDAGLGISIARKRMDDIPLTPREEKALTTAEQRQRVMETKALRGSGSNSAGLDQKQQYMFWKQYMDDDYVQMLDGSIVNLRNAKDFMGNVPKGAKILNPEEKQQYVGTIMGALHSISKPNPNTNLAATGTVVAPNTLEARQAADQIEQMFETNVRNGGNPDEVGQALIDYVGKTTPQFKTLAEGIVAKKKKKPDAQSPNKTLREISQQRGVPLSVR